MSAEATTGGVRRRRLAGARAFAIMSQLAVIGAVLAAWQLYSASGWGSPALAKSPSDTWSAFTTLASSGQLVSNLVATYTAVAVALVSAGVVGTVIGLSLALAPRVSTAVEPLISGLNAMPRIALAPVFVVAFGIGTQAKIALAFTVVVFVFILNAQAGVKSADGDVLRLSRAVGMTKVQKFFKVLLPVSVPSILAAVRLGLIYSLLGVVTMELISSRDGVGQLISQSASVFDMSSVYALLIMLAVIATLLDKVTSVVEGRLLNWQEPARD